MTDRSPQRERAAFGRLGPPDPRSIAPSSIDFDRHYSPAEWQQIRLGSTPETLPDDRWMIVEQGGSVYFMHFFRTVYKVDFSVGADGATARRAVVNIRRAFFDERHRLYHARHVSWLIDYWLLGQPFRDPPQSSELARPAGIELVRDPLPFIAGVGALAYGAKDSGRIGGGAAAAILAAAGGELSEETSRLFAQTDRKIGDAVVTGAYDLWSWGIQHVGHIVSIATRTDKGDWCPYPEKLHEGVRKCLQQLARNGVGVVAMSALATGEGRVPPDRVSREMLSAIRDHQRDAKQPGRGRMDVVLSLPTYDDYQAFEDCLARM